VQCRINLGWWEFGIGWGWGGEEKGEVSLRATWDQGGQGRITPKEGFQVSKGEQRKVNGERKGGYCRFREEGVPAAVLFLKSTECKKNLPKYV
jgi:hypothetical protein